MTNLKNATHPFLVVIHDYTFFKLKSIWTFNCGLNIWRLLLYISLALLWHVITLWRCFSPPPPGSGWSGWYAPPGIEYSNHSTRAAHESLKNAVVTCGEPPSSPPECTPELGPCLFDVLADPCEYVNQAKNHPDVVDGMLVWLKEYRETMVPTRNKHFDPRANPNNFGGVWSPWMDWELASRLDPFKRKWGNRETPGLSPWIELLFS